jgi:hypothetical protein
MTVPPQLGKLRHPRGRLAALGPAILVAAASFTLLTASASANTIRVRQGLTQNVRGAGSASIPSGTQKVRCVSGMGTFRREYACKTPMRLVCHKSPGQTVLRRISSQAYWVGEWHIEFAPYSHQWGASGPPVKGGRLSIPTPRGARREEAIVSLSSGAPPGTQVIIWARCS